MDAIANHLQELHLPRMLSSLLQGIRNNGPRNIRPHGAALAGNVAKAPSAAQDAGIAAASGPAPSLAQSVIEPLPTPS
ncbi:hypothetical protein [Phreatobacter sp.]|uniref:hypothetical protein n=1 Tax=Phreatobacter sp. TaxID=1966341 RepID=UPI003F7125D7